MEKTYLDGSLRNYSKLVAGHTRHPTSTYQKSFLIRISRIWNYCLADELDSSPSTLASF